MKRYSLSTAAERELDDIKAYLAEHFPGNGRPGLLHSRPDAGHLRSGLTEEALRFWFVSSYAIIYDPAFKPIDVVRIIHGARDVINLL
jgi:plasmid stabilization system protein ParE